MNDPVLISHDSKREIEVTCESCAHGHAIPELLGQGLQCRGAPPMPVVDRGTLTFTYPMVALTNPACGCHKPRVQH